MRTHVKNASLVFTIPLNGVHTQLSIPGSIYSTVKSSSSTEKALKQFCPDCREPIRLDVNCPHEHGPIDRATLLRGKIVDDQVVIIGTGEEAKETTESDIAKGKLSLTVVSRKSLVEGTIPNGTPYHFIPTPGDASEREAYTILHSAGSDNPDLAFVCRANIGRGAETLLSVEPGAFGGLTLQTLAYPETLYDLPDYDVEPLSKANRANVRFLLEELVTEFEPDAWLDRQAAAVAAAVSAAAKAPSRKGAAPKAKKLKESTPTLLSAIAAAAKAS
jgi:non-homologous end joining protein Ku